MMQQIKGFLVSLTTKVGDRKQVLGTITSANIAVGYAVTQALGGINIGIGTTGITRK